MSRRISKIIIVKNINFIYNVAKGAVAMENKKINLILFIVLIIIVVAIVFLIGKYNEEIAEKAKDIIENNIAPALAAEEPEINIVPTLEDKINGNTMWCGSFQLAWTDFKDNIVKQDIEFSPQLEMVKNLNTSEFNTDMISSDDYYIKSGVMTGGLKEEIENALKEKFDYTSNFLNQFNWEESNGIRYFAYAMLNKEFEFNQAFDDLNKGSFAGKGTDTKYFGLNANMNEGARSQVQVLYYNNENDKAILLETKQGDEVIIAMTNKMKNFNQVYEKITTESKNYQGNKALTDVEELKIPNLSIDTEKEFTDLENKEFEDIDGNKMKIDKALQTIDFSLDKTGGQVVSEAGMSVQQNGIEELEDIRNFNFDKEFVVFVREKDKTLPYFALNVSDIEDFQ